MKSSGEAEVVALARALFTGPASEVQQRLVEVISVPAKMSPEGLRVLEDTLAKGAVLWLAKNGAWRDRLWTKEKPPALQFEAATVQVLQWLCEQPLGHEAANPLRLVKTSSLGCELVLLAALSHVIDHGTERQLASQPAVRASPLCRVAFPIPLALAGEATEAPLVFDAAQDFALEALQPALAKWWRHAEKEKARMLLPSDVITCGTAQARVLDQLLAWCDANQKRERCTFLLEAMAPLLHERASSGDLVAQFDERMPLRDRQTARRAAGAALQGVARLAAWDESARTVRFIDDGYEAAQARVRTYEQVFGPRRFAIAHRLRDELEALPS